MTTRFIPIVIVVLLAASVLFADTPTLSAISLDTSPTGYSIFIRGSGELKSSGVFIDNPPRIVLDFPDTRSKLPGTFEPKANAFVSAIRSSEFNRDGQKGTRVVVELKDTFNFSVAPAKGGITLNLQQMKKPGESAAIPPAAQPPATQPAAKPDTTGSLDIVIGAEDLLEVNVFELPQFNVTTRVAGDGSITMPLIGSVVVRGLTKKEVERKLEEALAAKYVNNPSVSVTIKEYKSRQVSILGAVNNPGAYTIISSRTLLQLLSEAGGLGPNAGRKLFIFRQGAARLEIDLVDLMDNGNQALNVPILPGDVINIPAEAKIIVYVLGAVRNPGAVEMTSSMPVTLLAAIARAGGPTEQASKSGVQIRRRDASGQEQVIKANLKDILSGKSPDIDLLSGDVVNVPESFF